MNRSLGIYNLIDKNNINESIRRVINSEVDFYTYVTPKGLKELRMKISDFLYHAWNYKVNHQNILITTGSQQSINLIAHSLLDEKDTVLIEQPTYFGAIDVFKKRNVNLIGVNLIEDGFDLKELEEKIKQYLPKIIYVTPTFNNPTGYAWSNEKRKNFLKLINKYNIIVIEDDPYSYINFTNDKYQTLYELNHGKNIIYLGTFSKLISPSINVGYILCESKYLNVIYSYKKSFDLCTSTFLQYVILDYLTNYDVLELIRLKLPKYKKLLNSSIAGIKYNHKNEIINYTKSKGGIFYTVRFTHEVDENLYENLNSYYLEEGHEYEARVNICSFDEGSN